MMRRILRLLIIFSLFWNMTLTPYAVEFRPQSTEGVPVPAVFLVQTPLELALSLGNYNLTPLELARLALDAAPYLKNKDSHLYIDPTTLSQARLVYLAPRNSADATSIALKVPREHELSASTKEEAAILHLLSIKIAEVKAQLMPSKAQIEDIDQAIETFYTGTASQETHAISTPQEGGGGINTNNLRSFSGSDQKPWFKPLEIPEPTIRNMHDYKPPESLTGSLRRGFLMHWSIVILGSMLLPFTMIIMPPESWAPAMICSSVLIVARTYKWENLYTAKQNSSLSDVPRHALLFEMSVLYGQLRHRMGMQDSRLSRNLLISADESGLYAFADRAGTIGLSLPWVFRPAREIIAVLAHEAGHLYAGDIFTDKADRRLFAGRTYVVTSTLWVLLSTVLFMLYTHAPATASLIHAVMLCLGTLTWSLLELFLLRHILRLKELRADYFSGWLTNPKWLIEALDSMNQVNPQINLKTSSVTRSITGLLSSHPSHQVRIRWLKSQLK